MSHEVILNQILSLTTMFLTCLHDLSLCKRCGTFLKILLQHTYPGCPLIMFAPHCLPLSSFYSPQILLEELKRTVTLTHTVMSLVAVQHIISACVRGTCGDRDFLRWFQLLHSALEASSFESNPEAISGSLQHLLAPS